MIEITMISDIVCPYCYVAKHALEKALNDRTENILVRHLPFELTKVGKDRVDTYHDPVRRSHYEVLKSPCQMMELPMHLPPQVIPRPYSHKAFMLWFAMDDEKRESWLEAMFASYFLDEKDIGDDEVLISAALELGLSRTWVEEMLRDPSLEMKLQQMEKEVLEQYNPHHVPSIYIDGNEVSLPSYTPEAWSELLDSMQQTTYTENIGCGPDGCGPDGCC